jgi:hypothetical protein
MSIDFVYLLSDTASMKQQTTQEGPKDFAALQSEVIKLWEQNRLRCAWHMRQDFRPHSSQEMRQCLQQLSRHGDRATYISARRLMKCL